MLRNPRLTLNKPSLWRRASFETLRRASNVYTVHAEGRTEGGSVVVRDTVVRVTGGSAPFRFHAWRRGRCDERRSRSGACGRPGASVAVGACEFSSQDEVRASPA